MRTKLEYLRWLVTNKMYTYQLLLYSFIKPFRAET